ncbi:MAG TPA: maleylpyruvate isomerase N-terminal domain-containing protein [Candidatus Limnocylindrales bacterium]
MTDRSHDGRNALATARLRAFVDGLSDEDLRRDIGNGWTVAAALAHVAHRDDMAAVRWSAATAAGTVPIDIPLELSNVINDASLPLWRAIPARTAAELAISAAANVDALIVALSDAAVDAATAAAVPRVLDRSIHRNAHLDELELALGG